MTSSTTSFLNKIWRIQIFRFFLVAFIATISNYSIFYLLLEAAGINYLTSSGLGFLSGVILGYFLNRRWTFTGGEKSPTRIIKYFSVYLISLGMSLLIMRIAVGIYKMDPRLANILTIMFTFCTNYAGTRLWVFRERKLE